MKGKITLNKWHFKFGLIHNPYTRSILFHFGIFKPISFPNEGWPYQKENYKGFWYRKDCDGFEISITQP
jgi:hypothetical protein